MPALRVELAISLEVHVPLLSADHEEVADLWTDAGNARLEITEDGARAAIAIHLVIEIFDEARVELLGK
jgi:hypothetical protein